MREKKVELNGTSSQLLASEAPQIFSATMTDKDTGTAAALMGQAA